MDFQSFLERCRHDRYYAQQICATEELPARPAVWGELSEPLPDPLAEALAADGITQLYGHQAAAVEAARRGEHLVLCTGTASGKTLGYNLPALEHWLAEPEARALYLFPTKALAQDQLRGLQRFRERQPILQFEVGTYDGDTPNEQRARLRNRGHFILTNPDMLHSGILPHHTRWSEFFSRLRYIVLDEVHTYRGVFGSNVANVLLRLRRIAEHYGTAPQFICCSATVANPVEHVERLIGATPTLIDEDGSPRGPRRVVLWNPPLLGDQLDRRRSPSIEAQSLMAELLRNGVQTICFTRARVMAELLYRHVHDQLLRFNPRLATRVRAYRGGYLAEERREIEQKLFSGELLGVISTNALELGIDIGGLDACLIVGYPGSVSSTWQQAGRAGRGSEEALVVLIASDSPLDQYLMQNPDYFFNQAAEHAIIDPANSHILVGHLRAAAAELPVVPDELDAFGEYAPAILDLLEQEGQVRANQGRWYWTGSGYPAGDVQLRTASDDTYNIIDSAEQRVIATVDGISAFSLVHEQAIYLQHGETWFVERLDLQERNAYVKRVAADYFTTAVTQTSIHLDRVEEESTWRDCRIGLGDVTVTIFTVMFRKVKFLSQDSLGFGNLDLPPQPLDTSAMWLMPPDGAFETLRDYGRVPADGMLGIANVLVDIVPLYVLCDPADIGCVVDSTNLGTPTIFIYDRFPGGLGFAYKAYELLQGILEACVYLVHHCPCEDGCPSCVGSAARNFVHYDVEGVGGARFPDKEAALVILHRLLNLEPYIPRHQHGPRGAPNGDGAAMPRDIKRLPQDIEDKIRRRIQGLRKRR